MVFRAGGTSDLGLQRSDHDEGFGDVRVRYAWKVRLEGRAQSVICLAQQNVNLQL